MTDVEATYRDPLTDAQQHVLADVYRHVLHLQQQASGSNVSILGSAISSFQVLRTSQ